MFIFFYFNVDNWSVSKICLEAYLPWWRFNKVFGELSKSYLLLHEFTFYLATGQVENFKYCDNHLHILEKRHLSLSDSGTESIHMYRLIDV